MVKPKLYYKVPPGPYGKMTETGRALNEDGKAKYAEIIAKYPHPTGVYRRKYPKSYFDSLQLFGLDELEQHYAVGIINAIIIWDSNRVTTNLYSYCFNNAMQYVLELKRQLRRGNERLEGVTFDNESELVISDEPLLEPGFWTDDCPVLNRREKRMVRLRYYDGLTLEEVAEYYGVTHQAIQAAINKALQKLERHYGTKGKLIDREPAALPFRLGKVFLRPNSLSRKGKVYYRKRKYVRKIPIGQFPQSETGAVCSVPENVFNEQSPEGALQGMQATPSGE